MSTTASPASPSYVIPHTVTDANPGKAAIDAVDKRNEQLHALVQVSKGKVVGGKHKNKNKNKKSKKYSRKSVMKKRFSKKFRRSISRRKSRKMSLYKKNKKALHGGASGDKWTIPSFSQTSVGGANIINRLAGNHAQTLAYSTYDDAVSKPPVS